MQAGLRYGRIDPAGVGVHVETPVSDEAEQRHPALAGQFDRQAGRGPDGAQDRDAGDRRLLHQLEADPAADQHQSVGQGNPAGEEFRPDQLVQGVVAADVLPEAEQPAGCIEET